MSNQEHADLCRQLERIEKRITALQEHGIDVSSLTSQLSMARELLNDEKYNDAQIFCEELIALADQLAQASASDQGPNRDAVQTPSGQVTNQGKDQTKRYASNSIKRETVGVALSTGIVAQLVESETVERLLPSMENTAFIRSIVQNVSEKVLAQLHEQEEGFENIRIEQALQDSVDGNDGSDDGTDIIHWLVQSLTTGAISQSIESFSEHLEWQLQQMIENKQAQGLEQTDQVQTDQLRSEDQQVDQGRSMDDIGTTVEEAYSARIIPSQVEIREKNIESTHNSKGRTVVDNYQESDSFSDLPQIPKPGESWDDDSSIRSLRSHSDQSSGEQRPVSEGYEPATGSTLRPNTSVFTEVNAMSVDGPQMPETPSPSAAHSTAVPDNLSQEIPATTAIDNSEATRALQAMIDLTQQQQQSALSNLSATNNASPTISKQDMKEYLRAALPELLQEDDIKQALFAALAVEVLCNPSVLGSMTGLRDYMKQELLSVQENM